MTDSALLARFASVCARHAARAAILDAAGELSFEALYAASERLARQLAQRGLSGQRIALLAPPSRDWAVAFWGILLSGAEVVPLCQAHPAREHSRALAASRAAALVRGGRLGADLFEASLVDAPEHGQVVPLDLEELLDRTDAGATCLPPPSGDSTAVVFFTSGTTGAPKAARLSHDQLAHMARMVRTAWGIDSADRLVHCLPLHHMHGLGIAYLVCQQAGASVHLLGRFEASSVWEALGLGSVFMAVPTMHQKLLDEFDRAAPALRARWQTNARALRLVTSGSAALPSALAQRWANLTGRIPLERFGMTEVGVALSNPLHGERVLGSAGRPLPGMQVRIVDDQGRDAEAGARGELWIRGPSVFSGYDAEAPTQVAFSPDGWFKSGDTATWLHDGFVKILGRTSVDIIKSGGYKLSALEIEEALREHPLVNDAAVVGMEDPTWGERVVATVTLSAPLGEAEVREFLKARLAPYKIPKRVFTSDGLPRNVMGKVDKQQLKALLASRLADDADEPR